MIQLCNLRKSFGDSPALCGLTMEIGDGELFGFVGPNGAGKTTTMKIIVGLLRADSGDILIDGRKLAGNLRHFKAQIGYVPDFFGVYDNLRVYEYMEFYASLYGMSGREARRRSEELLGMLGMTEWREELVDSLSRGMKQKLCVARALVNDPKLLVLDEPASGMEPKFRRQLRELLQELCAEGKTILISSHNLRELFELCTNIGIMDRGRLLIQGDVREILRQQTISNPYILQYIRFPEAALELLKTHGKVKNIAKKENSLSFPFEGTQEEAAQLLTSLISAGAEIASFVREEGSLEKLFLEITAV